jgi:hypothetical protein
MNPMVDAQELARRFNEDEAVWRCFESKRAFREWLCSRLPFSEHILDYLDYLDWLAAERECREVRAIGFPYPQNYEAKEAY